MGDPGRGAFPPSPWLPGSSFVYSGHGSFLLCSEATVVEVMTEMGRSSRETTRARECCSVATVMNWKWCRKIDSGVCPLEAYLGDRLASPIGG